MERTDFLATAAILLFATGTIALLVDLLLDRYKLMRVRRRIRCLIGRHDAGPVRDVTQTFTEAVGGRRVQRCDWCDKVVREYEVTVNEARQASIRRIY